MTYFIFLGSKITADADCVHEIKRYLLLERKTMIDVDRVSKSIDITLLTKAMSSCSDVRVDHKGGCAVKAM